MTPRQTKKQTGKGKRIQPVLQESLRESDAAFVSALDAMPDAMVVIDQKSRIILANRQVERVFGYTQSELPGKNLSVLVPERFRARHAVHEKDFFSAPRHRADATLELFALRKDGTEFPAEININHHKLGGEMAAIAAVRDITERRRLEQGLIHSNNLISALSRVAAQIDSFHQVRQIFEILGSGLKELNIESIVALLEPDTRALTVKYTSIQPRLLSIGEKVLGIKLIGYRIEYGNDPSKKLLNEIMEVKQPLFVPNPIELTRTLFPGVKRTLVERAVRAAGINLNVPVLYLPLISEERIFGVLGLWGSELLQSDLPALTVFASQAAAALMNAHLHEEIRDELTEIKQADEKLRESERRNRALFDQYHDAVFILDLEGNHLDVNQRAADMLGYTREEMIGLSVRQLSAEPGQSRDVVARLIAGERIPVYERLFRRKDGGLLPVEINVELIRNPDGSPQHIQSVVRDISERKQAEEKLRQSEERFDLAMQAVNDGIWDWDIANDKVYFDPRYYAMAGYASNEFPQRLEEWRKRIHPDDFEYCQEMVDAHLAGRTQVFDIEFRFLRKDGTFMWIRGRGKVVAYDENGKVSRMIGTHTDITDRKQAQEALHRSEEQYRFLLDNTNDFIARFDRNGVMVFGTEASLRFNGYRPDEIVNTLSFDRIHPEDRDKARNELKRVIETGAEGRVEYRLKRKDGAYIWVEAGGRRVLNPAGEPEVIVVQRDVTERKRAEEALRQSEEKFSRAFISNPAAIILSRLADGLQLDVNDAFCRLVGYSRKELLGHPTSEFGIFIHPDQRRELVEQLKVNGEVRNREVTIRNQAGELRTTLASMEKLEFNDEECCLTTLVDITDRKQAQADLSAAQQSTQATIDGMRAQLCVLDGTGKILSVNRAWREFADANPPAPQNYAVGFNYLETCEEASGPNSQEAGAFAEALRSVLSGASDGFDLEYPCHVPGGEQRWFTAHVARFFLGGRMRVVITHENITGRVLAEMQNLQLKRLYATLSQVNQTIMRVREPGGLYQSICDLVVEYGEFSLAWVGLLEEESGDIKPVAATGMDLEHWTLPIINIHSEKFRDHLTTQAIQSGMVTASMDVQTDPRLSPMRDFIKELPYHSTAVVPFKRGGKVIGTLAIVSPQAGFFQAREEVALLEEMGLDITFALDMMENDRVKRQWADAFEHSAHGISIGIPGRDTILTCNPAFARQMGRSIEETASMPILDMYAPQDRELAIRMMAESDRTGNAQYEARKVRKDGTLFDVQMDMVSVRDGDGNLLYRVVSQQDITERKRAEEALQASEERFRTVADFTYGWEYWLDENRVLLYISPSCKRLTGYDRQEFLNDPKLLEFIVHPEDRAGYDRHSSDEFAGTEPGFLEFRIITADGQERWIDHTCQYVYDEAGKPGGRRVSNNDITERRRAEESLRESEARYKLLFESNPHPMWVYDMKTLAFLMVNDAAVNEYGYTGEEFKNMTIKDIRPAEDISALLENLSTQTGTLQRSDGWRHRRKDGSILDVEITSHSLLFGSRDARLVLVNNVTERKQAEMALKVSEENYRSLAETSDSAIAVLDRQGAILYANPASKRVWGREDLIGRTVHELYPKELADRYLTVIRMVIDEQVVDLNELETPINGRWMWFQVSMSPIKNSDGSVNALLLNAWDITDRVSAREELAARHRDMVQIARELQESHNMLELIIESAPVRVFWKDNASRYLGCNELFARDAGYNHPGEVVGKLDEEFIWKENAETFRQEERQIIETGVPILNQVKAQAVPGGGIMWINVSVVPLRDSDGKVIGTMGIYEDISEQQLAEEALRKSEARFRALFDDVPIAIWEQDFSEVRKYLDALKAGGVTRLRAYFSEHPQELIRCLNMVRILDINQAAVRMYEAKDKQELIEATAQDSSPGDIENGVEELIAIAEGRTSHFWEGGDETMTGRRLEIRMVWSVVPGHEQDYARVIVTTLDITERKHAEEELLHSKALLTEAQQISHLGNWEWDLQEETLFWSDEVYRIFGVSPVGFIPSAQSFEELVHPADREEFLRQQARMLEEKGPVTIDYRILLPNGEVRHVQERTQLVQDERGRVVRVVGTMQDITERKLAEETLRASEKTFHGLFNSVAEAIYIQDAEGRFLDVNEGALKMYGRPREFFIGNTPEPLSAPGRNNMPEIAKAVEMAFKGQPQQFEFWGIRSNAEVFPKDVRLYKGTYFGQDVVIAVAQDITERKQAEMARERLLNVLEASLNEIYIFDPDDLKFEYVNSGARINLGYSLEELKTMTPVDLKPQFTEASFRETIAPLLGGEKPTLNFETIHRRANGSLYPVDVHLQLVETGNERAYLAVINDITQRKQAELSLSQRLAELELLYQSGLALGGELEPKQVAGRLIDALETKMDWHHIAIRKYDPDRDRLEVLAFRQPSLDGEAQKQAVEQRFNAAVTNSSQGMSGWAVRNGQTVRSGDVKTDARYTETYPGIGSGLYAPMTLGGRVVGVISVESKQLNAFDESDERLLKTIANQAAVAFENARLFQDLQRELTERIQAEAALRESEERLRLTLQTTSDGFWIVDQEGAFLEVNNAYCEMSGYSRAELLQMRIPDVEVLESMEGMRRHIARVEHERHERFETRHRRKDGSEFDVEFTVNLLDEETGLLICFCRDITERKRAEREIIQRTRDLALLNTLNEAANRGESVDAIINLFTQEAYSMFKCRDAAVYLLTPDGKYLEMHKESLSNDLRRRIEDFIGISIPRVRLPIREGSYTQALLSRAEGMVTDDPLEIQKWILEFTETPFLADVLRAPIRAIVPRIFGMMGIHSTITIPLVSSGQTIGLMDFASADRFTEEDLQRLRPLTRQITAILLRKQAESNVVMHLKRITALNEIDHAIGSSLDLRLSLEVLLKEVVSQLGVDAADVLLLNPVNQALEYVAGKGFNTSNIRQSRLMLGEGLAGRVGMEQKVAHIPDLKMAGSEFVRSPLLKGEEFVEYFGVPLLAKGALKGVLEIFNRAPLAPDPDWLAYLGTLGGQAAIAIDNAQLFEGLQKSNQEMMAAYDATIAGWSHAMDLRDKETEGHSQRVTEITLRLASRMGVSQHDQIHIRRGALLHDIGKLGVPDQILLKPGKLTEEEWEVMRRHPGYAYEMLLPIAYLRPALDIPYSHHEKWDGTGYPLGLRGEQIPLAARIFAVVDVWDALRSDRPYRPGWSAEKIRDYILAESGKHFDPQVVETFIKMMDEPEP